MNILQLYKYYDIILSITQLYDDKSFFKCLHDLLKITETVGCKNTLSDVFKLLTNVNIVIFFVWIILMGICTSMVWNYLFW